MREQPRREHGGDYHGCNNQCRNDDQAFGRPGGLPYN
jgi:hypothetical protein